MSIHTKSLNRLALELEQRAELRKSQEAVERVQRQQRHQELQQGLQRLADPVTGGSHTTSESPLYTDSSLGVRTGAAERTELRKAERAFRLDMGFAGLTDIGG